MVKVNMSVELEDVTNIQFAQINELLKRFSEKAYSSKIQDVKDEIVIDICIELWKLDYSCEVIDNKNGSLCSTYPSRIIVPVFDIGEANYLSPLSNSVILESIEAPSTEERLNGIHLDESQLKSGHNKDSKKAEDKVNPLDRRQENGRNKITQPTFSSVVAKTSSQKNSESKLNGNVQGVNCVPQPLQQQKFTLREYFQKAIKARCRYRFPIPCVLCKGRYISRSATLSCYIDVIGKQILHSSDSHHYCEDELTSHSNDLDRARAADISLLDAIGTSCIVDLMVENKKVKYSINVSSSEKADKENRYSKFSITSIPYPGCEFFKEFTQQKFRSSNLYYNWEQAFNDATLSLEANDDMQERVTSEWGDYKSWDLRKMTENYLKLILRYISDDDSKETGCLVHCISGWDRTPLFVSLVRLSLWADGLVHSSLDAKQMLFFTLAYDWYLYGHQLPDRLKSKENILYFCFEFLEEIYKDPFLETAEKRERHLSTSSCTSAAYDSATGGLETPASSFGSATSLASSTSSTPAPPLGASTSQGPSSKVYVCNEDSHWPFNKENGFSFDGISENAAVGAPNTGISTAKKDLIPPPLETVIGPPDRSSTIVNGSSSSPCRSPLKERNKGSMKLTPSPGGLKGGSVGFRKVNGFLRDLPVRRSRKTSTTESPSTRFYTGSESIEINTQSEVLGCEVDSLSSSSSSGTIGSSVCTSNPVPVPGGRSRHNSTSSVGSWQLLSISDPLESNECHKSSRTSLTADMVDSTHTIKEEVTPSSSLESSQSIIVFNRKRRLTEIRDMFFKVYSQEVPSLYPEWSFLSEIVQNIYQKLGS